MADPRVLSVCSGIGGLDLGVAAALAGDVRVVAYVEREFQACRLLAHRMAEGRLPVAPIWTDVHTFPADTFRGVVDGIIGGYPCQPFSHAGQRRGQDDDRHLWPAIARLVGAIGPAWCVFENVSGHLSLGSYEVIRELQGLGYTVASGLFAASEVGAPHKRERLFIVAHGNGFRHDAGGISGRQPTEQERTWTTVGGYDDDMGDGDRARPQGWREPGCECADELPAWPPGPADELGWQWVLERWPELAPAVADTGRSGHE